MKLIGTELYFADFERAKHFYRTSRVTVARDFTVAIASLATGAEPQMHTNKTVAYSRQCVVPNV
jgi:hypothetical protein